MSLKKEMEITYRFMQKRGFWKQAGPPVSAKPTEPKQMQPTPTTYGQAPAQNAVASPKFTGGGGGFAGHGSSGTFDDSQYPKGPLPYLPESESSGSRFNDAMMAGGLLLGPATVAAPETRGTSYVLPALAAGSMLAFGTDTGRKATNQAISHVNENYNTLNRYGALAKMLAWDVPIAYGAAALSPKFELVPPGYQLVMNPNPTRVDECHVPMLEPIPGYSRLRPMYKEDDKAAMDMFAKWLASNGGGAHFHFHNGGGQNPKRRIWPWIVGPTVIGTGIATSPKWGPPALDYFGNNAATNFGLNKRENEIQGLLQQVPVNMRPAYNVRLRMLPADQPLTQPDDFMREYQSQSRPDPGKDFQYQTQGNGSTSMMRDSSNEFFQSLVPQQPSDQTNFQFGAPSQSNWSDPGQIRYSIDQNDSYFSGLIAPTQQPGQTKQPAGQNP